jgi:CRP-like cAMP-binding protein
MERCKALVWDYTRVQALLLQYPQIGENISHILASRLKELEERFREIATEKVATRLALALLRLLKQVGKVSGDGTQVFLNREELAQMTGTTIFTISRILSRWAEQGFVVPRREAILISDPKGLESVGGENSLSRSIGTLIWVQRRRLARSNETYVIVSQAFADSRESV